MKALKFSLAILIVISSCSKQDNTDEVIKEVVDRAVVISEARNSINDIIDDAISSESTLDPDSIAKVIADLEGVHSASSNETGTCVRIQLSNGSSNNILLVAMDDERLFEEATMKSLPSYSESITEHRLGPVFPNGDGKALILVPFPFAQDIGYIEDLLSSAGYKVDVYKNEQANLERFRGSFLDNYDIVYISTHGTANELTRGGFYAPVIMTGEKFDNSKLYALPIDEQNGLAGVTTLTDSEEYFGITAYWLRKTSDNAFPNSWIFINACESAGGLSNETFSKAFLEMGAKGFHGWSSVVFLPLAASTAEALTYCFSSGLSFNEASYEVRHDPVLTAYKYVYFPFNLMNSVDVTNLVDVKDLEDPFYITDTKIAEPFTDPRDGNVYDVVRLGEQLWIAENLKYIPQVSPPTTFSNTDPNYYVWNYNGSSISEAISTDEYESNGVYYNWPAATDACPEGWHLPTIDEWHQLTIHFGVDADEVNNFNDIVIEGSEIISFFDPDGFNAKAGTSYVSDGYGFVNLPSRSIYWSSSAQESNTAWQYDIGNIPNIIRTGLYRKYGLSVRCVMD